ncbi:hypothetical protein NC658_32465 [Streptomyces griseoincarnatus]|uniref:Transcriptional regulator n=1 Tax=Streptomyces griseoincarnatus TaxID=29305 RepID=A0ABT0W2U5_STRGI|nr:hypothetical protein [Streptomyces griseoincarnatus]MCM2517908.1 hypothetical protein [Streptomyces griseoincarnatus]
MNPSPGRGSTPDPGRHHRALVEHLVSLKKRSGRSYARLASNSRTTGSADGTGSVSATTLKRVVDLTQGVPVERAVTAYVRACGVGGEENALGLWRAARVESRGRLAGLRAPHVDSIRTRADLAAALAAAYERAGAPALRVVRARAADAGIPGDVLLPLSTVWRTARRRGLPATWKQCAAFLRGCGVSARHMGRWEEAWERAVAGRTAVRGRSLSRPARGALVRRGRTPSPVINWTPELEQSLMTLAKALAICAEDVKPKTDNMARTAVMVGKVVCGLQLERSGMAAVNALSALLRSLEATTRLNGLGPSSGQLPPVQGRRTLAPGAG